MERRSSSKLIFTSKSHVAKNCALPCSWKAIGCSKVEKASPQSSGCGQNSLPALSDAQTEPDTPRPQSTTLKTCIDRIDILLQHSPRSMRKRQGIICERLRHRLSPCRFERQPTHQNRCRQLCHRTARPAYTLTAQSTQGFYRKGMPASCFRTATLIEPRTIASIKPLHASSM